jgi:cobalamin biosynthesis Mg chelatase CobN
VGTRSKRLRRGTVALACVVIAAAAAGPAAADGPKPERSPARTPPIRPEAAPSAPAAQTTQRTFSSYQGSSTPSYTPPSTSQTSRPAVTYRPTPPARPHTRATQTAAHRPVKKDPPVSGPTKPVESIASTGGQILVTSAHGLTKAPSSSESLLLLLVGLALVVLVVGETTFLRLAARGPAPQRAAEEPLPIRQVQLRR